MEDLLSGYQGKLSQSGGLVIASILSQEEQLDHLDFWNRCFLGGVLDSQSKHFVVGQNTLSASRNTSYIFGFLDIFFSGCMDWEGLVLQDRGFWIRDFLSINVSGCMDLGESGSSGQERVLCLAASPEGSKNSLPVKFFH